jgi:membrane protease YdiL (CAAX protease family)
MATHRNNEEGEANDRFHLAGQQPRRINRRAAVVLPFVLYLAIGPEPKFDRARADSVASPSPQETVRTLGDSSSTGFSKSQRYVVVSLFKFLVVGACLVYFLPTYCRCFPVAIDRWGWGVGVLGVVIWVGLCNLTWESKILGSLGFEASVLGQRSQFNPFEQIESSPTQVAFILVRFGLLVLVVPLAEEIFLRGFLMRIVQSSHWPQVRLQDLGWPALVVGSVYGLPHPNEALRDVGSH